MTAGGDRPRLGWPAAFALPALLIGSAMAQDEAQQATPIVPSEQVRRLEGKEILGVSAVGMRRLSPQVVLAQLNTQRGRKLSGQAVREDLAFLWNRFKVRMRVVVRDTKDGVHVRFVTIQEYFRFEKTVFRGLRHFTVEQVRKFLGLDEIERLTQLTAESLARQLEDRYRRDGYAHVRVGIRTDEKTSTVTLLVDEGPIVRVRSVRFRGNKVFPDTAFLGLQWNLTGSARMKSTPGLFSDAAYSQQNLEDDLDRLREFYRGRGYKDAVVELYDLKWDPDRTGVHIVIRVFEGALYRVDSVDIEVEPFPQGAPPRYPKDELLDVIELEVGQPLTQDAIDRDKLKLALFYGRRGYPSTSEHPNLDYESSFRVLDPVEIVDPDRARVQVVYRVKEGKRKRLRDIRVQGNRFTRDAVVRRELSVFPGDWINMEELSRSEDRLLALRYFGDYAIGDQGVRMRLRPVEGDPELVDLDVEVTEGQTGQILWGLGISSNTGFFGNVQYNKRNFDWRRPPTSLNPVEWFTQILNNEAFHGGGQTLNLDLAPGTEVSQASISFFEPDFFGTHIETIGLGLQGYRRLRRFETYDTDTFGGRIRLERRFGRDVSLGVSLRNDRTKVDNIAADAPSVVWDAEGKTSIRALGASMTAQDLDSVLRPTFGYRLQSFGSYAPEWIGSGANFWKAGVVADVYLPIYRDSRERAHVVQIRNSLHVGGGIDGDDTLYLTERLFMGGQGTLRGFDFRRAGPTQFGRPTGGELRYLGTVEYTFPVISTRLQGGLTETELIRGVLFSDAGMLGDGLNDPLFRQLRLTAGFGVRILIPGLGGLPIAFDFGWPIYREETDRLEVFSFTFKFN